jgi:Ca-activated chloride channel family protein
MFDTVRFVYGHVLYLLLLLPLVWLARRRYLAYLRESRKKLDASVEFSTAASFRPLFWTRLTALLFLAAAALLMLALAKPQVFKADRKEILRQLDVVFLLDTSPSMGAEDVAPSRLERATRVIREIVVGEPLIQRVGLVTFSRSSLILSYLTSDVENILFYLDFLREQHLPGVGTNIGAAIASGIQVIELRRKEAEASQNHPIMILLSDGEDHEEELEVRLQQASRAQLTVYTIGIASEAGGFIPIRDEGGNVKFVEDLQGTRLISRLDESTLRRVAEVTGGRFYRAVEGEEVLAALREILSRENQVAGFREDKTWIDLYPSILATAAVLALLGWTLGKG